jgi:hypothetical protein
MTGKPEAPVDDITEYPLPFVPDPNLPPVPPFGDWDYDRSVANFHHPVFRHWEVEKFGIGGKSARDSRIQWVRREHHDAFHQEWDGLDEHMPRTRDQQYVATLVGAMGYVPERGISFARHIPRVIRLTGQHKELLRTSGQLIVGNDGGRVRRFLLDYTFRNGAPLVDPELIDEFLWTAGKPNARPERALALADILLRYTIEPTTPKSLDNLYTHAKRNHALRPRLPRRLASFIRKQIIFGPTGSQREETFVRLILDKCREFRGPEPAAT